MGWTRYSAEVADKDFEKVVRAFASLLSLPKEVVKDGVSELVQDAGQVSLAVDVGRKFIAARSVANGKVQEVFFARPGAKAPRIGCSFIGEGPPPPELQPWLHVEKHRVERLPSFTSLSCALASQGHSVTEMHPKELQLEAEIDYLKQLLAEQSDHLRQTRGALKDISQRAAFDASVTELDGYEPNAAGAQGEWDLEDLAEWCAAHESEIVVLPRARNGVKKSRYEDPSLIVAALELLAGPYRDYHLGLLSREDFEALMHPTGLRLAGSVAPSVAGEQGSAYFVNWAGRRCFLDSHLLKGGGRDERYCLRVYFFWDGASQRAVVGSMPAHLDNSLS